MFTHIVFVLQRGSIVFQIAETFNLGLLVARAPYANNSSFAPHFRLTSACCTMSERLHELQRLAGLDAMLFHFNFDSSTFSPCANGAVDVMPILNIPAGDKRDFPEQTARSPLSHKAHDMNTVRAVCLFLW